MFIRTRASNNQTQPIKKNSIFLYQIPFFDYWPGLGQSRSNTKKSIIEKGGQVGVREGGGGWGMGVGVEWVGLRGRAVGWGLKGGGWGLGLRGGGRWGLRGRVGVGVGVGCGAVGVCVGG